MIRFVDLDATHAELGPDLEEAFRSAVATSGFVGGAAVDDFERHWARYCGGGEAVGVANGTDALLLGLRASGIGAGDEVLVPANTFVATAEAVALAGATPVFVDVDRDTLLIDPDDAAAAITARTAALMAVHLYGQLCDMDTLSALCSRHGIALLEDAAQAHGARWNGQPAGSFGRFAGFSFYPGKNLGALGDAGAVVTSDPDLASRIRGLGNHGRGLSGTPQPVATNSRLDALQARVLTAKLAHLDDWNVRRRAAAERYDALLAGHDGIRLTEVAPGAEAVHHLYVIRVADRDALQAELTALDIQTGVHYPVACHEHPAFRVEGQRPLPVAEDAARSVLSLPMHPHLTDGEIEAVSDAVIARRASASGAPR